MEKKSLTDGLTEWDACWSAWDAERKNHPQGQYGDERCFNALMAAGFKRQPFVRVGLAGPFYG